MKHPSRLASIVGLALALPALAHRVHADGFGPSRLWSASFSPAPEVPLVGDFNGDRRADVISFVRDAQLDWRRGDVDVALSTGIGLAPTTKWHDWFCLGAEVPLVGDFNGDHKDDIALFKRDSSAEPGRGDVIVALSTGSSFGAAQVWQPMFGLGDDQPAVGDFNGDGLDDVAVFKRSGKQAGEVWVALSTGSSFGPAQRWATGFAYGAPQIAAVGDFDGDGDDDIILFKRSTPGAEGQVWVAPSTRAGFGTPWLWSSYLAIGDEVPVVGDVDGDGAADVIVFKRGDTGDVLVARSGRWFFGAAQVWHDWFGIGQELPAMGDLNGDGRSDALLFKRTATDGQVLVALDADPSQREPDGRGYDFGYDTLRSADGKRAQGARPLLGLLVDFSDQRFRATDTAAHYRDLLFVGAEDPRTVAGFYRESSAGLFWWTEAGVIGPFTATDDPSTPNVDESRKQCAKGGCPGSSSSEAALFRRAIANAAAQGVDFARFDADHDGQVTAGELGVVVFSAAGPGDGYATTFGIGCQLVSGPSGSVQVCPTVASAAEDTSFANVVHELGHSLGAWDLYGSTPQMGAGATVMATVVGGVGARPSVDFDAYHKMAFGWIAPRVYDLTQPGTCEYFQVTLADDVVEPASYWERPVLLYDPRRGGGEYLLLEYRLKDPATNRYDGDVAQGGLAVWYVRQDGAHKPPLIRGLHIERGNDNVLETVAAAGSDDYVQSDGAGNPLFVWAGADESWQSVLAADDIYYWDRAVFEAPVGLQRGTTKHYTMADGKFRLRWLTPGDDAELSVQVAPVRDERWLAVRWGHNALDVLPILGVSEWGQYCQNEFR